MRSWRCAACALLSVLAACGDRDRGEASLPEVAVWTVAEEPLLTIGGYDDRTTHALSEVRGGLLLPDGEIAIADGLSREIRLFSAEGAHLRTLGGRGGGPGEFASLGAITHGPDGGVCGWDGQPKRLTCFPRGGGQPTTADADDAPFQDLFFSSFVGAFADGSFVVQDGKSERDKRDEPSGERRDTVSYLHFAANGAYLGTLARLPGTESHFLNDEGEVWGSEDVLFGRRTLHHLDGALALGMNDSLDLRVLDRSGRVESRIATTIPLLPVSDEEVDSARARLLRELEENEARRPFRMDAAATERLARWNRKQIAERPYRETKPAFDGLRIAHDGRLWVGEPRRLGAESRSWTVVDPREGPIARVDLPAGAQILDIDGDRLLLLMEDELDVESVRLMSLQRS